MDYVANAERGEVIVRLDGAAYPMLPTHEAQVAVETRTGCSMSELWLRCAQYVEAMVRIAATVDTPGTLAIKPGLGLKLSELEAIITEFVRAAGKARGDADLRAVGSRVLELIVKDPQAAAGDVYRALQSAVTGGRSVPKGEPPPAASL